MTTTATPVSQAVTEWTKIFSKQVTETYTGSVTFMKQLTVVAVSTITYLKNVFPEDSYMTETFGGLKLRILKKKCRDELAQFLTTALTQGFEAFDKKYLHQLALCFYDNECNMDNLIEYHIFEYSYNPDGVSMNVHSKTRDSDRQTTRFTFENVRERTIHMVRACVVIMQTCQQELPPTFDVSLRLYYNEDAPEGYQAPGYLPAECEDHLSPSMAEAVKLGCVETPFHRLVARSYIRDGLGNSHEANPTQNPPMMTPVDDEDFNSTARTESESPGAIRCPCNKNQEADVDGLMLTCQYCGTRQHAACFGVWELPPATHCCVVCADSETGRRATEPGLATLSARKRECLCIFRRTLRWSAACPGLSGDGLARRFRMSSQNAHKLLRLLHSHGVVAGAPGDDPEELHEVIRDQLNSVVKKFFQQSEETNIVDRLLAETFSQDSKDPVGDVLGPLEKVSLQNANNIGKVINSADFVTPPMNDSTLQQYREAILSNIEEDLPLSGSHNPVQDIEEIGKKKTNKRKVNNENEKPALRTGVRTKKAKLNK